MTVRARCVVPTQNVLGEGIVWDARGEALYWTDIQSSVLWRYRPSDRTLRSWAMPERLACFALCEADGWLLLGLASRLAFLHLPSGCIEPLCEVEADLPTRVNDGACDRQGRYVFGTLHEPDDGGEQRPLGGFYRLDTDLTLERLPLPGVAISNSLAFSPDGRTLYFCDTPSRCIQCCDYGADGRVGTPRPYVQLEGRHGGPDGAAVDAEGGLWSAQWGLGRVVRYAPDGREDTVVEVPASQPTRVAFGGRDLNALYISSAREGLSARSLRSQPLAGAVFVATDMARGVPEPRFAGMPPDR